MYVYKGRHICRTANIALYVQLDLTTPAYTTAAVSSTTTISTAPTIVKICIEDLYQQMSYMCALLAPSLVYTAAAVNATLTLRYCCCYNYCVHSDQALLLQHVCSQKCPALWLLLLARCTATAHCTTATSTATSTAATVTALATFRGQRACSAQTC